MQEFSVRIQGLDQLVGKLREAPSIAAPILARALSASQAILAKHTTKGVVPWRTGFLVQSFRAEQTTGMLRWFPTASYAPYVQFGTKPHVILPKDKKALYWPGADHPVKRVNHPGTAANDFIGRIVAASQGEIDATFGKALEMIAAQIATQ
jgi:hypothetical protein